MFEKHLTLNDCPISHLYLFIFDKKRYLNYSKIQNGIFSLSTLQVKYFK